MTKAEKLYKELQDFEVPKSDIYELHNKFYHYDAAISKRDKQIWCGRCSRLITDMSVNGATAEELEKAILFSIVVIDSDKKRLLVHKAYDELGIRELEQKYMNK